MQVTVTMELDELNRLLGIQREYDEFRRIAHKEFDCFYDDVNKVKYTNSPGELKAVLEKWHENVIGIS